MTKRWKLSLIAGVLFLGMAAVNNVEAQSTRFGIRGGANLDRDDLFLGAHAVQGIHGRWIFNPNFEYTFVDDGSHFTINADFHYDFPSDGTPIFWLGAGAGIGHTSLDDNDETELGLNLLSGVSFGRGRGTPFIQAKVQIYDDTALLIGGGITF
jgi:hypothetical protein